MIGIVLVSHSAMLAEGVRELVVQMVRDKVPIAVAGGVDNPDEPIGTDPFRVLRAIQMVYSEDGVILLMDLGSALMSAEASLDFLSPEQRAHIYLCEAPLVEGAIAAAVRAMAGGTVMQVLAEARGALNAKRQQLLPVLSVLEELEESSSDQRPQVAERNRFLEESRTLTLTVPNQLGLHARPAAKLVDLLSQFSAEVRIAKGDKIVSAKSINELAMLGARQGDELVFYANGVAAVDVLAAIASFSAENFGDADDPRAIPATPSHLVAEINVEPLAGVPASGGIAIGPVFLYEVGPASVASFTVDDPEVERVRLLRAIEEAEHEIEHLRIITMRQAGAGEAEIFSAHARILRDPVLLNVAEEQIYLHRCNAEAAWHQAIVLLSEQYRLLPDENLRSHVLDVFDAGQRVLRHLAVGDGEPAMPEQVEEIDGIALRGVNRHTTGDPETPVILVTKELIPSAAAALDPAYVAGIVMAQGSPNDHSAILARALNIPAVVGVTLVLERVQAGQIIALDGDQGRVWLTPSEDDLLVLEQARATWRSYQAMGCQQVKSPARLRSGEPIGISANISSLHEIELALAYGAEGVGLFRSEFLFMERDRPPSEEEQLAIYAATARALGNRPLVIRTLDVGGDKPLSFIQNRLENNPFLASRGLRLCLEHPELFKPQLRALLRVAAVHSISILLPMVSTIDDLQDTYRLILQLQAELRQEGLAFSEQMPVGVMIETPAAVMLADVLARHAAFFSLGTNDLAQYIMAADRSHRRVSAIADGLQPAMLRAIQHVLHAAHHAGVNVSICGEMASDPLAAPLLVGLGLTQLSMNAPAIPAVKARLCQFSLTETTALANKALQCVSAPEVNILLNRASQGSGSGYS